MFFRDLWMYIYFILGLLRMSPHCCIFQICMWVTFEKFLHRLWRSSCSSCHKMKPFWSELLFWGLHPLIRNAAKSWKKSGDLGTQFPPPSGKIRKNTQISGIYCKGSKIPKKWMTEKGPHLKNVSETKNKTKMVLTSWYFSKIRRNTPGKSFPGGKITFCICAERYCTFQFDNVTVHKYSLKTNFILSDDALKLKDNNDDEDNNDVNLDGDDHTS